MQWSDKVWKIMMSERRRWWIHGKCHCNQPAILNYLLWPEMTLQNWLLEVSFLSLTFYVQIFDKWKNAFFFKSSRCDLYQLSCIKTQTETQTDYLYLNVKEQSFKRTSVIKLTVNKLLWASKLKCKHLEIFPVSKFISVTLIRSVWFIFNHLF